MKARAGTCSKAAWLQKAAEDRFPLVDAFRTFCLRPGISAYDLLLNMEEVAFLLKMRAPSLGSQQLGELFNPEVRVPNDSAEKWFFDGPARMNGYHRSSLRLRVN